jgi:chromosome segregation ATPase
MGQQAKVTLEELSKVADQMLAKGQIPSARALRAAIGAGSMTTIHQYLRLWQQTQPAPTPRSHELPPALQKAMAAFIEQEINQAISDIKTELANEQQANQDLIVESERRSQTSEEQAKQITELQSKNLELSVQIAQLSVSQTTVLKDIERFRQVAELTKIENAKLETKLEAMGLLQFELDRLNSNLLNEQNLRIAAEQSFAVAIAKTEMLQTRISEQQEKITTATERIPRQRKSKTSAANHENNTP